MENIHPALLVWSLLAIPLSGISFLITYPFSPSTSMFHLFLAIMNVGGILVMVTGVLQDRAEEASDWEEDEDEARQVGSFTLTALVGMLLVSLFLSLYLGSIQPSIWVPYNLYPMSTVSPATPNAYMFVTDIFGTWFSVVPGEENMKKIFIVLHKVYEGTSFADLPFAFQPAILLGNGVWSVEHVINGQYPVTFALSVFVCGLILDSVSARTGTVLTGWLGHASFNSILQFMRLLSGGFIRIG